MSLKRLKKPKVVFNKRSKRWGIDYDILDGGRVRRVQRHFIYTNKSEAEEKAQKIEESQEPKVIDKAKLVLNNAQIHETLWALEELEKMPFSQKSLRDAILFFRDNYHEPKQYPRLATLIENYLKLKKEHQSLSSYEQHRTRLRNFKKAFRGKNVYEVSSEDIIEYLKTKSEGQQLKYLTYLSTFYNYICDPANPKPIGIKNPITAVKFYYQKRNTHAAAKRRNKLPTILHYDEVVNALQIGLTHSFEGAQPGVFLAPLVFGIFLGMRPSEIENLSQQPTELIWSKVIQLKNSYVVIDETINQKTHDHRLVTIQPNVKTWLDYIKKQNLPLFPKRYIYKREYPAFRKKILGERSKDKSYYDVFRHTYVTWLYNWKGSNKKYRYSLDDVIRQVGHSMQVNSDHYRGKLFNDEDANEYWNLTYQSIHQKVKRTND